MIAAVLGVAVVFLLDRGTKVIVQQMLEGGPRVTGHGLISVVWHENEGVIANVPLPIPVIVIVTIVVLAAVVTALLSAIRRGRAWTALSLGVLIGGALGNLYDRIVMGYVFDWILLFGRSAINIADVGIVAGALTYFAIVGQTAGSRIEDHGLSSNRSEEKP